MIRSMFGQVIKTNDSLELAVLIGCLRISKESIFTGMNRVSMQENPPVTGSLYNLRVEALTDEDFSICFGFTDEEVREMLAYYGLGEAYGTVKEWYDEYRFGSAEVYCPWDVVNHVERLRKNPKAQPQNYWANSSGNDAVTEFVRRLDTGSTRQELQSLVEGGTVRRESRPELTYRDIYNSVENLWSLLYMTGYLTGGPAKDDESDMPLYGLSIPNREIRGIFMDQIMELFREEIKKDGLSLERLCGVLAAGDAAGAEAAAAFSSYLRKVISIRDTSARNGRKENFYHGILLGILSYKADWIVTSNRETGDGIRNVLKYGIACYKKRCRVALGK